jgi:hypothetical protein
MGVTLAPRTCSICREEKCGTEIFELKGKPVCNKCGAKLAEQERWKQERELTARKEICNRCSGSGRINGFPSIVSCNDCGGTGQITVYGRRLSEKELEWIRSVSRKAE